MPDPSLSTVIRTEVIDSLEGGRGIQVVAVTQADYDALVAERDQLIKALVRARDDMEGWGAYASPYFQEKWDLAADLAALDAVIPQIDPNA